MATASNRFGCLALRYTRQIPSRRKPFVSIATQFRPRFSYTRAGRRNASDNDPDFEPQPYVFDVSSLDPESRAYYDSLSPEHKVEYESSSQKLHEHMSSPEVKSKLQRALSGVAGDTGRTWSPVPKDKGKPHFFNMGEEDKSNSGIPEEFAGDDITSLAHGELEQHREMREYARIAAWEMPLLSSSFLHCQAGSTVVES